MWTAIILFMVLGEAPHVAKSKTAYMTEQACTESLAGFMTGLKAQNVDLMTGKCVEGQGQPVNKPREDDDGGEKEWPTRNARQSHRRGPRRHRTASAGHCRPARCGVAFRC